MFKKLFILAFLSIFISIIKLSNSTKCVVPASANVPVSKKGTIAFQESQICPPGCTDCVVRPLYTPQQTNLTKASCGSFDKYKNKPITNGRFVHHRYTEAEKAMDRYNGQCGLGVYYAMHAAVGSALFSDKSLYNSNKQRWVCSNVKDLPGGKVAYILNDDVCVNKCVKIECPTTGKTLTIPIMDETDYLKYNELDVTGEVQDYFGFKDTSGWVKATITYMDCPQ